jgi:hypothetical protein
MTSNPPGFALSVFSATLDLHEITNSAAPSRRRLLPICSTEARAPCAFPLAWTAARVSPSSRSAAPPALTGDPIALIDPPPEPLTNVTAPWRLVLAPAPATVHDQ